MTNQVCNPLLARHESARNRKGYSLRQVTTQEIVGLVAKILQQGGNQCTDHMDVYASRDASNIVKWNGEIVFRVRGGRVITAVDVNAWSSHLQLLAETVELEQNFS